jgi:hypothetical protein
MPDANHCPCCDGAGEVPIPVSLPDRFGNVDVDHVPCPVCAVEDPQPVAPLRVADLPSRP